MKEDAITGEVFARIVGKRSRPPLGEPPSAEAQAAHASLQRYRTRAPKGIFLYRSHEEMEADRLRWTVEAMVHHAKASAPAPAGESPAPAAGTGTAPPGPGSGPEAQNG